MGKPIPVADKVIAESALIAILDEDFKGTIPEHLIDRSSRVQFRPSTRQLVLVFDLKFGQDDDQASSPVE